MASPSGAAERRAGHPGWHSFTARCIHSIARPSMTGSHRPLVSADPHSDRATAQLQVTWKTASCLRGSANGDAPHIEMPVRRNWHEPAPTAGDPAGTPLSNSSYFLQKGPSRKDANRVIASRRWFSGGVAISRLIWRLLRCRFAAHAMKIC